MTNAERIAAIKARHSQLTSALPGLREARNEALGDGDSARADQLRLDIARTERELEDAAATVSILERRERQRLDAESAKRQRAAQARLAELSRTRVRIGRKIDLAWASIESALQELDALENRVRATSAEAGTGVGVSWRLAGNAHALHRGAALATAPTAAMLLGVERLPSSARRTLEAAFKVLGALEVQSTEGEAA
jgi:hypothetical protein